MKTYLIMYFGTAGMKASETAKKVEELGFITHYGPYDFIYNWGDKKPTKEDILALGDRIAEALKGSGAVFNIDTRD
jgi:hypothetical protein